MKNLFVILTAALLVACGGVDSTENTDLPQDVREVQEDNSPELTYTSVNGVRPAEGYITGNLGDFSDIDSYAYEMDVDSGHIDAYAEHEDGRVMVRLAFGTNITQYLDYETYELSMGYDDMPNQFLAIGCQGRSEYSWDFDSHADYGNIVVTPIDQGEWLVEYDLYWTEFELHGHMILDS